MKLLLCFSGAIGSGKSSVSTAVANALGWQQNGFGDYLRREISRRGGDPNSRQALQDLGQQRVEADPAAFCRDVLAEGGFTPGADFVIDGIRHVSIFDILAQVSKPSQARLLFLQAEDGTRATRVGTRSDAQDFARASEHRVEEELRDALPHHADGVVNAEQSLDRVVSDCLGFVSRWHSRSA